MVDDRVRLTREQLYELVWSKPMRVLAGEYGLSDVGLAKICARLNVPRPPRGYWVRLEHGQQPPRARLPPRTDGIPGEVALTRSDPAPVRAESPVVPAVVVRPTLARAHAAVVAVRQALEQRGENHDGMLVLRGSWDGATVRVSPSSRDRVLCLLDALFAALASRGHEIRFEAPNGYGTHKLEIVVSGETVALSIVERMHQKPHVLTAKEREHEKRYTISWAPKFDQIPSGRLTLKLHAVLGAVSRGAWSDGAQQRLEDVLGQVVLAIEETAATLRRRHAEQDARRRAEEEERLRHEEEERRARYHKALGEDLLEMTGRWSKAEEVRAFLRALDAALPLSHRTDGFTAWFEWATAFAEMMDPLASPTTIAKRLDAST